MLTRVGGHGRIVVARSGNRPSFRIHAVVAASIPPLIAITLGWSGIIVLSSLIDKTVDSIAGRDALASAAFTTLSLISFFLWLYLWREMSKLIISRSSSAREG